MRGMTVTASSTTTTMAPVPRSPRRHRAGSPMKVLVLLVVVMVFVAGCGSDSGESDEGVASLTESEQGDGAGAEVDEVLEAEEAMLAFSECLREQGLEVEDPEFDDEGNFRLAIPMDEFMERMNNTDSRAAFDACSHLLMGVAQQVGGFDVTEMEDRLVAYAACMRDNGFDMPDPDFGTGGMPGADDGVGPFSGVEFDDPAFIAANDVCQTEFGDGFGPGGFGSIPTSGGDS